MSEVQSPAKPPIRLWPRVLIGLVGLVVLLIIGGIAGSYFDNARLKKEREELEAYLDQTDPNWRLGELMEAREQIPDTENSALVVAFVAKLVPDSWPSHGFLPSLPPQQQLDKEQTAALEENIKAVAVPLTHARRLADMPRGRHNLEMAYNPLATLLPDQQHARRSAALLNYDSMLLAHQGDIDGALRSARGCVNAGRSLGDEPLLISQLVRLAGIAIGCNAIERALAQGEASDEALAKVQQLLELEQQHQTLRIALRGERAMNYDLLSKLADGRIRTSHMQQDFGMKQTWWDMLVGMRVGRREPIHSLRLMTRAVEATQLPLIEQMKAENEYEADSVKLRGKAPITQMLIPAISRVGQACRRKSAQVSSLMVLVAVERYRLKHGKWPDSLDALKPVFLKEIPVDVFDGKPIRYKKLPDGVVVYSVGLDGKDDSGTINRNQPTNPGVDQGYRLWDVKARRQKAPPEELPPPDIDDE